MIKNLIPFNREGVSNKDSLSHTYLYVNILTKCIFKKLDATPSTYGNFYQQPVSNYGNMPQYSYTLNRDVYDDNSAYSNIIIPIP